jgi:hypothetical protein
MGENAIGEPGDISSMYILQCLTVGVGVGVAGVGRQLDELRENTGVDWLS